MTSINTRIQEQSKVVMCDVAIQCDNCDLLESQMTSTPETSVDVLPSKNQALCEYCTHMVAEKGQPPATSKMLLSSWRNAEFRLPRLNAACCTRGNAKCRLPRIKNYGFLVAMQKPCGFLAVMKIQRIKCKRLLDYVKYCTLAIHCDKFFLVKLLQKAQVDQVIPA